jgi:hypothetical protein
MYILRKRAGVVVAGRSTDDSITDGGTVSRTTYVPEVAHTFETTGICCQYGASRIQDYSLGASSGKFGDVVRKNFDMVGPSISPTVDYRLEYWPHC